MSNAECRKWSAQSKGEVRKEETKASAGVRVHFNFLPLKTLRGSCPSRKRVSSATWLSLEGSLGFKRVGVNKKERVIVHKAVLHLHASPTHSHHVTLPKASVATHSVTGCTQEPPAKSRSCSSADPSVCIQPR